MAEAEIYMARDTYMDYPLGPNAPTPVAARQTARAGHPIIARTPSMWVPLEVDYDVEQPKAEEKAETPKRAGARASGG